MVKLNNFCKIIILFGLVLFFSCGQDPIFYTISTEPRPVPPRIQGSPTKMVLFKYKDVLTMYVASGRLYGYTGKSGWNAGNNIPQPGKDKEKVIGLASTDKHLYALCIYGSGVNTVLRRIGSDDDIWRDVTIPDDINYTLIQSIFADSAAGRLFAGAMNNKGSYGILYLDDTLTEPTLRLLISDSEMLSGVASMYGVHYLCTRGKGIYSVAETVLSAGTIPHEIPPLTDLDNPEDEGKKNRLFMGMIQLEDGSIIVVERNEGALFEVQASGFKQIKYTNGDTVKTGRYATGALALWQQVTFDEKGDPILDNGQPPEGNSKMLVAGIQGGLYSTSTTSSYTHGYVEFYLDSKGSLDLTMNRNDPPTITVGGFTEPYTATIGKHPINHLFQTPPKIDESMTFFASTQTAGLWSYRKRTEGWQWNAEGENEP